MSSDGMRLLDRENEILKTLDELSRSRVRFVLVGGYAVSALAGHRFSVDCDLVIRQGELRQVETILASRGFSREQERSGLDKRYGGRIVRYVKRLAGLPVSADLMVNSLVCRDTEGAWSFEHIYSNSTMANVSGSQFSVKCRIPNRELLLSFKLHSARKTDVRDIVMLADGASWKEVPSHLNRGEPNKRAESLDRVLSDLQDPKLVSSLKGVFSIKKEVESMIEKALAQVKKIADQPSAPAERRLARKKTSRSMFGSNTRLRPFSSNEESEFHEL